MDLRCHPLFGDFAYALCTHTTSLQPGVVDLSSDDDDAASSDSNMIFHDVSRDCAIVPFLVFTLIKGYTFVFFTNTDEGVGEYQSGGERQFP